MQPPGKPKGFMIETETSHASRFLWKWTRIILAIAFVGTALLIWWGESHQDYWASFETMEAGPSIEIIP